MHIAVSLARQYIVYPATALQWRTLSRFVTPTKTNMNDGCPGRTKEVDYMLRLKISS